MREPPHVAEPHGEPQAREEELALVAPLSSSRDLFLLLVLLRHAAVERIKTINLLI